MPTRKYKGGWPWSTPATQPPVPQPVKKNPLPPQMPQVAPNPLPPQMPQVAPNPEPFYDPYAAMRNRSEDGSSQYFKEDYGNGQDPGVSGGRRSRRRKSRRRKSRRSRR